MLLLLPCQYEPAVRAGEAAHPEWTVLISLNHLVPILVQSKDCDDSHIRQERYFFFQTLFPLTLKPILYNNQLWTSYQGIFIGVFPLPHLASIDVDLDLISK